MEISSETLEKLKEQELKILIEFDKVCKKIGVNYTLSSGTLLGAIRHKGFIPWDDDIDVAMLREDYNKFVNEGQNHLPENLFVQTFETDKEYPFNFSKIRDTSTILVEYSIQNLNMKNGLYIDIFPIDCVSSNKMKRWFNNQLLAIINILKFSYTIEWANKSSSSTRKFVRKCLYPLSRLLGTYRLNKIETYIRLKGNKIGNKYTFADNITPPNRLKSTNLMPVDFFKEFEEIHFENYKFKAIKEWNSYLTVMYDNYMKLPPKEKQISLHDFIELKID